MPSFTLSREVPSGSPPKDQIEPLLTAANDAAHLVRNVYITFLLMGPYIAVIIGATTDEQLLKVSPVTLPLLNVGLPIVGFYALIPWLFVLLHFNLLLQLYLLAQKLHPLDATLQTVGDEATQQPYRVRLFPFPFSYMLIGRYRSRLVQMLFTLVVWITTILLPLLLLTWAQIRFLPYHDVLSTWFQRAAIFLDLALLWIFWPVIIKPTGQAKEWWKRWGTRPFYGVRYVWKWILSYRVGVFVLFPVASAAVTRLWVDEYVSLPVFMSVGALLMVGCLACDLWRYGPSRRSVIAGVFTVIIAGTYLVSLGSLLLLPDGASFFPRL